MPDDKDAEIGRLRAEVDRLSGVIKGRIPLAALRDFRGNVNSRKYPKPPTGYVALNSPRAEAVLTHLGVPFGRLVSYRQITNTQWSADPAGHLIEQENAALVAELCQRMERGAHPHQIDWPAEKAKISREAR